MKTIFNVTEGQECVLLYAAGEAVGVTTLHEAQVQVLVRKAVLELKKGGQFDPYDVYTYICQHAPEGTVLDISGCAGFYKI